MKTKKIIVGVDEVGRGCLAGPLVAAAVVFKKPVNFKVKDSKKLNYQQRDYLARKIKERAWWSISSASVIEINKLDLQKANILAARRAIDKLKIKPDMIKLDYIAGFDYKIPFQLFIKGDERFKLISAASIIAKDYRDKLMIKQSKQYDLYGFEKNKGYGTKAHLLALEKHGPCRIHRLNYEPVKQSIRSTKII